MADDKPKARQLVERAYAVEDDAQAQALYRDWAQDYDASMLGELGYLTPARAADLLAQHLAGRDGAVLDVGCGTGLAGAELARHGFSLIDGIDYSPEMLAVAAKRGIYRRLVEADLNGPLDLPSDSHDAAICTGTFTHAHVGAECLDELLRVLKPGAPFACTVHLDVWEPAGFAAKSAALQAAGRIETLHMQSGPYYAGSQDADGHYIVWRKAR